MQVPVKVISHTWNHAEVLSLLSAYKTHEDKFRNVNYKKKRVWEFIAKDMADLNHNSLQCESKWKSLTRAYRNTVDHNNKTGRKKKTCPCSKELGEVYGYHPNISPAITLSSGLTNTPSVTVCEAGPSYSSSPQPITLTDERVSITETDSDSPPPAKRNRHSEKKHC